MTFPPLDLHWVDLPLIGFLVFMEIALSIDNAVVLAVIAKPLPPPLRKKALTYGLIGAVVFRLLAVGLAAFLMRWSWVKLIGGGYLLVTTIKHFLENKKETETPEIAEHISTEVAEHPPSKPSSWAFWKVVITIELMDVAFAVDSILAAVAVSNRYWIVFVAGISGALVMRFAAALFLKILDRFPNFEQAAFLLIAVIGAKLFLEGFSIPGLDFHHRANPAFWIFWALMAASFAWGFRKPGPTTSPRVSPP